MPSKKIGKYIVTGLLGRGGMARIYKVVHPVIGKIGALKRLEPSPTLEALVGERALRDQFISEARTMARVRHPNLVPVLDFGTEGGRPWYVMDLHGISLGDLIGEGFQAEAPSRMLRIDRAVDFVSQTLEGLGRLHFAGIVHRDIKPFNLLLNEDGRVQIADFGLSILRGESLPVPANLKVGSPFYAAPEQEAAPDRVDFSADLFSVGVMLWRMLTGMLPKEGAPRPSRVNPDLDPDWDRFLFKATAARPVDRFSTAAGMQSALREVSRTWQEKWERLCRLPDAPEAEQPDRSGRRRVLRRAPVKVRPGGARALFNTDPLWRPARYWQNDFAPDPGETISDRSTGRLWERAGTPYPVTWHQAKSHVSNLNRGRFAGRSDWRLPTVDELMTLLDPPPRGRDFCLAPIFAPSHRWLWSCDRCSFISAWYVDAEMGFVHRQDLEAPFYARAVCG